MQRPDDDSAPDDDLAEANRLTEIEFRFTFTDLTNFVGQLVDVSIDQDQHDVGELRRKVVLLEKITRA
ncbi:hypothetical protein [Nocardia nepalensis]|uniref:hypothetical protein n=1 Tax=Nocardia nepalensis TaxID=3375448 RepID=UPI003B680AA5